MRPTLDYVEKLARQAGEILRAGYIQYPGFEQSHQIQYKGAIDLVTDIDRKSEAFLLGEIRRDFPDHKIVAEESGGLSGNDCCQWLVDPIDGTVNYAHGIPMFCVSVAYIENGAVELGAVYAPAQDELFSAQRGHGAHLNGRPIRVSQAPDLDHSLLVTGFPYDIRTIAVTNLEHYARFATISQGVRRLGSAALDLCYIGAGRFDGYWELYLQPWDIPAGALIAQEAGALVTTVRGEPNYLQPPASVLAANPTVHAEMLSVLRELER